MGGGGGVPLLLTGRIVTVTVTAAVTAVVEVGS